MPGCAVHFRLALKVLDYWQRSSGGAPFSPTDPAACNAFLCGCNAPDMGYFPGGDPLLTDFSHYIRSADLARNLVQLAGNDVERAFAWGWITHILGDAFIHPLVNQAVGEFIQGDPKCVMTYADDPVAHVQVEMGADGYLHILMPVAADLTTQPVFDSASIGYLERVYQQTYNVSFARNRLLASHRAVSQWTPWLLAVDRINGARFLKRWPDGRAMLLSWTAYGPAGLYAHLFNRKSFVYGLTHTTPPAAWLVEKITGVIDSFAELCDEHRATNLTNLPHYNLDTGFVEGDRPTYPLAVKAYADLQAQQKATGGDVV